MWMDSGGKVLLKDIAAALGVGDTLIRKWKNQDKWETSLNGNVTNESNSNVTKRMGAPKGNRNAIGNKGGAPMGNKQAMGNRGGNGGPLGNKKAVKTGEHETIWLDALDEDELELLSSIDTDPVIQADETIALLSLRERRMLLRIQRLNSGLTEKQRRVLQELRTVREAVQVHDDRTGKTNTITVEKDKMVESQIEETSFRTLEDILRIEDALTRVQEKKLKAIELKNRLIAVDEEKQVRTAILQIELQQLQGGAGATQSWTDALKEIAERRKAVQAAEAQTDE
ncbi:terminase [Paenibacillus hemerocallicola]|uniref:Terminase n=2 Tax=Paenibacillus hemerocallicola TaxID=1172614 RepID=A0A5C4TH32_9BACL|nr:terminase [Paenibacillus hemerocallicola]